MNYIRNYLTLVNDTKNNSNEIKQFKCKSKIDHKESKLAKEELIALLRGNVYVIAFCLL